MSGERVSRRELFRRGAEKTSRALGLAAFASLFPKSIAIAYPLIPETEPTTVTHWDGKEKRINPGRGVKLVFVPGMNTNSQDDHTFDAIKQVLQDTLPFDEKDELDMTYHTEDDEPRIGRHYDASHANRKPVENYQNLRKLFEWYRDQFAGDKFILFGHSQGGYMSYLLAQEFKDVIAGVITYDSPLKGADIVPTGLNRSAAQIVGGDAAAYYVEQAENGSGDEVEKTVEELLATGMFFATFASTTDLVVSDQFSYLKSANHEIAGEPIIDHFDMTASDMWPVSQSSRAQLAANLDSTTSLTEETKQRVKDNWLGHGAVMANPRVLDQTYSIVKEVIARIKDPRPDMHSGGQVRNSSEAEFVRQEEFLTTFIEERPRGPHFAIEVTPNEQFYVILQPGKESEGWNEFQQSLTQYHLTNEQVWRRLFSGVKYEQ